MWIQPPPISFSFSSPTSYPRRMMLGACLLRVYRADGSFQNLTKWKPSRRKLAVGWLVRWLCTPSFSKWDECRNDDGSLLFYITSFRKYFNIVLYIHTCYLFSRVSSWNGYRFLELLDVLKLWVFCMLVLIPLILFESMGLNCVDKIISLEIKSLVHVHVQ